MGWTPGGNNTVDIYTQIIHRITQSTKQYIEQHSNRTGDHCLLKYRLFSTFSSVFVVFDRPDLELLCIYSLLPKDILCHLSRLERGVVSSS